MEGIILQGMTTDQLLSIIRNTVKEQVQEIVKEKEEYKKAEGVLLTTEEAAEFLKVEKDTIYSWRKQGLIQARKISSRTYYLKQDLIDGMKIIKRKEL